MQKRELKARMSPMRTMTLGSWDHFLKLAEKMDVPATFGKLAYSFRGQSKAEWSLKPSLLRRIEAFGLTEEDALHVEAVALAEFKAEAHLYLHPNALSTTPDTVSWWTLMQHHGAPTRVLDWTDSFFVGAYFAVNSDVNEDGAVWILHVASALAGIIAKHGDPDFKTQDDIGKTFLKSSAPPSIAFFRRNNRSERMLAQQGSFTMSRSILADHAVVLDECLPDDEEKATFLKAIIPAKLKPVFMRKLRAMNITARSLFPGIDGLGESISELLVLAGRST